MSIYMTNRVEAIENEYNPEHDMPEGVQVTWVDMKLLELIRDLYQEINQLRTEIKQRDKVIYQAYTLVSGESLE